MRITVTELTTRLTELAEALQAKPPGAKGMLVWMDVLAECQREDVLSVLTDWPKSSAKMPSPADVLRLARERISDRIEKQAADNAKDARRPWSAERLKGDPNSPAYAQFRADMAALKRRPKPGPKDWAAKHLLKPIDGFHATPTTHAMARAALRTPAPREQESEADREARLEREAIQAEVV